MPSAPETGVPGWRWWPLLGLAMAGGAGARVAAILGLVDYGLQPLPLIAGILSGAVLAGGFAAFLAVHSRRQHMLTDRAFGYLGSAPPAVALAAVALLWWGANAALISAIAAPAGSLAQAACLLLALVVPVLALAWRGGLPAAALLAGVGMVGLAANLLAQAAAGRLLIAGGGDTPLDYVGWGGGLVTVAGLCASYGLLWAPLTASWGGAPNQRLSDSRLAALIFGVVAGSLLVAALVGAGQVALAGAGPSGPLGLAPADLPLAGQLSLAAAALACNVMLLAAARHSLAAVWGALRGRLAGGLEIVLLAAIPGLVAAGGAGLYGQRWLPLALLLSLWAAPWAAIMTVHLLWVRRSGGRAPERGEWWRWLGWGLPAWAGGLLAAWPFLALGQFWQGPWGFTHPHAGNLAPLVAAGTAAVVYALGARPEQPSGANLEVKHDHS